MSPKLSARGRSAAVLAIKLVAIGAVSAVLFVLVLNAMRNPVDGARGSYTAEFSDVSGLHVNGDVRTRGMRIGKVNRIDLRQRDGKTYAEVQFTMQPDQQLTSTSTLAVKYQSLTGVRYVDFAPGKEKGEPVTSLGLDSTRPSFDITSLFNGLAPVLSTMKSQDVNAFTENAIALLQGDGTGLGPMLDSTQKLTAYAKDRTAVISTLVENLSRISDTMGGRSVDVLDFLRALEHPIDRAITVIDEFSRTASAGPKLFTPIHRMVVAMGLTHDLDLDALIGKQFKTVSDAVRTLEVLPGAVAAIQGASAGPATSKHCSRGNAPLPADVKVLLGGSEVVLCRAN